MLQLLYLYFNSIIFQSVQINILTACLAKNQKESKKEISEQKKNLARRLVILGQFLANFLANLVRKGPRPLFSGKKSPDLLIIYSSLILFAWAPKKGEFIIIIPENPLWIPHIVITKEKLKIKTKQQKISKNLEKRNSTT